MKFILFLTLSALSHAQVRRVFILPVNGEDVRYSQNYCEEDAVAEKQPSRIFRSRKPTVEQYLKEVTPTTQTAYNGRRVIYPQDPVYQPLESPSYQTRDETEEETTTQPPRHYVYFYANNPQVQNPDLQPQLNNQTPVQFEPEPQYKPHIPRRVHQKYPPQQFVVANKHLQYSQEPKVQYVAAPEETQAATGRDVQYIRRQFPIRNSPPQRQHLVPGETEENRQVIRYFHPFESRSAQARYQEEASERGYVVRLRQ